MTRLGVVCVSVWALAMAVPGGAARAQAPRWTLADFPRHPGEIQAPLLRDVEPCLPESCLRYVVLHPIEEVLRFYLQRLPAPEATTTTISIGGDAMATARALTAADNQYSDARNRLTPGQATPLQLRLFTSTYAEPNQPADVQEHYRAGRAPNREGAFVARAEFVWAWRSSGGELAELRVQLTDALEHVSAGAHATEIAFFVSRRSAEVSSPAELTEPSAADLGVPVYPGARFNASNSSTDENGREYVYESADPPATVIQFYEARLGRRAVTIPDVSTALPSGIQAIVLQGTPADPKEAVAVQPGGTGDPSTSSVIIILKPPR